MTTRCRSLPKYGRRLLAAPWIVVALCYGRAAVGENAVASFPGRAEGE